MTCYSSRYLGDKIWTYTVENEKLLHYLLRKITKKFHSKNENTIFRRGYSTTPLELRKWSNWCNDYVTIDNNLDLRTGDYPLIYFDFLYHQERLKTDYFYGWSHLDEYMIEPYCVVDDLMEASMIKSLPIIIPNQRHSSNAKYFRLIIPLNYYKYNKDLTFENKKRQTVIKYNTGHKLINNYLHSHYKDLFPVITYYINYPNNLMEYYLYYNGQKWHINHINEVTEKILEDLYKYAKEQDLLKEYYQSFIKIQELKYYHAK